MDWGSLAAQLAGMGASTQTVNTALEGARAAEARYAPPSVNPVLEQQQRALTAIAAQRRPVDMSALDLGGLWMNAQGFWMDVTGGRGPQCSYIGRDLLDNVAERGTLTKLGNGVACAGTNGTIGQFAARLEVVNEDLLVLMQNGLPAAVLRRITTGHAKPYAGG